MFVDSHCHLDFPELAERLPAVLDAMSSNAVTHALCISVTLDDWPRVMAVAGSGALYLTSRMQRLFRDAHAANAHVMFSADVQGTIFGQHALGAPGPTPML